MTEERHRFWDLGIKTLAIVVTLGGVFFGYLQFRSEWEFRNRAPFLELRTKFYLELVETASQITYPQNDEERKAAIRRFWQLYVGSSGIVEDSTVEEQVADFSLCVTPVELKCDLVTLEVHATRLASAVRTSLAASWNLDR